MSEGIRVRLSRVAGETPRRVLDHPLVLPATMGTLSIEEESLHTEYTTVSAGQFSQGAQGGSVARQLRTTDIETLTLTWDAAWLVRRGLDPERVRRELEAVLRSHKAVELLVTLGDGGPPELRVYCTLRTIKRELRPGETDTRYYTVSIKEWRDPSVKRRGQKEGRKPGVTFPLTVKLKATDTLHSLAHEYYGRYEFWRDIRDANGSPKRFGQNTPLVKLGRFKVGSKIKMPIIQSSQPKSLG